MISGTIFVFVLLCGVEAGRVLVLPGEFSHWHNMRSIVDALVDKNHSVTVLVSSSSPTVQYTRKERFNFNVFKVNMKKEEVSTILHEAIHPWVNYPGTTYEKVLKIWRLMSKFMVHLDEFYKGMFHNEDLMHTLRESHYDVLLSDPMMPFADLMAETLKIPHVLSFRAMFAYTVERVCGQIPTPPSYVPAVAAQDHLTDHMNFLERVENMLHYIMYSTVIQFMPWFMDPLYTEILGNISLFDCANCLRMCFNCAVVMSLSRLF